MRIGDEGSRKLAYPPAAANRTNGARAGPSARELCEPASPLTVYWDMPGTVFDSSPVVAASYHEYSAPLFLPGVPGQVRQAAAAGRGRI